MNLITIIIWITLGIICAIIHKKKGYSPIAGFAWGFFLSIIGLIVVLLEKDKEEKMAEKQGLQMWQWLLIFLGIGIMLIAIFIFTINITKDKLSNIYQLQVQESSGNEADNITLNINYSSNITINNDFKNIENLYYYINEDNWDGSSDFYCNTKDNMGIVIKCEDINDEDIENYVTNKYKDSPYRKMIESKKVNINDTIWNMFTYYYGTGNYNFVYIADYNNKRYEIDFTTIDNSNIEKNIEEFVNTLVFR